MKRYGAYRETNMSWCREIPETWDIHTVRSVFQERKEKNSPKKTDAILSLTAQQGVIPYSEKKSGGNKAKEDITLYHLAYPGDLVMNSMNIVSGSVGLSKYYGAISPVYYALHMCDEWHDIRYYAYLFGLATFQRSLLPLGNGILMKVSSTGKLNTVRKRISMEKFNNVELPAPPIEEQHQIVRYLDAKTAQIDCAVHGYERLIALLEERKTAVINEAVTKGVRRGVEMKKSGVDWLGEIPAHWEISNVKKHFHIQKDIAGREGYDVLSITQTGLKKKNIASNEGQMANDYSGYQFVHQGEFAMNHMDLLTGYIGLSPYFGVTSPDYRVFVLDDKETCDAKYFLYVFQLGYKRKIFYKFGRGAASQGRWRLPARAFLDYVIPLPPIDEQRDIVRLIDEQQAKLDKAIAGIQREIELLHERRTRLVSDVVTGQVDVRTEVLDDGDGCVGAGAGEADHALSV